MFALPGQVIIGRPGRRRVVGGGAAKTYAEYQAHLATRGTFKTYGSTTSAGSFRTTAVAGATGAMRGTPWGTLIIRDNTVVLARIVQHSLPSEAVYNAINAAGTEVLIVLEVGPAATDLVFGIDRNGFFSGNFGDGDPSMTTSEVIYWDGTQAQKMNPSAQTGPTPYTW